MTKPIDTMASPATTTKKPETSGTATKQEPAHSSAKRVRGPTNIYAKLLPITLAGGKPAADRPSFLAKLLPLLRPARPANLLGTDAKTRIAGNYHTVTNSVWVTAGRVVLWQQGFFGKGSLSRSEPTWLQRAKNRKLLEVLEDDRYLKLTAEELTAKRRVERKESKIQKSKLKQLAVVADSVGAAAAAADPPTAPPKETTLPPRQKLTQAIPEELRLEVEKIEDLEHLQLMNEEAFFLTFGLGCLDVFAERENPVADLEPLAIQQMWELFCRASLAGQPDQTVRTDNPFILSYVVYHHFRSLGWVVRSGIKFCADWVLYGSRGPVGGHAEFAVCMIPVYADGRPVEMMEDRTSWRWLGTVNRVCAGVKKTLILVHVVVPLPDEIEADDLDSPQILTKYIIKEIALKRFIPARMRD